MAIKIIKRLLYRLKDVKRKSLSQLNKKHTIGTFLIGQHTLGISNKAFKGCGLDRFDGCALP